MLSTGIKAANRTGTLLRHNQKAIKAGSVVHFASAVYRYIVPALLLANGAFVFPNLIEPTP
jgi:hypothetical protein